MVIELGWRTMSILIQFRAHGGPCLSSCCDFLGSFHSVSSLFLSRPPSERFMRGKPLTGYIQPSGSFIVRQHSHNSSVIGESWSGQESRGWNKKNSVVDHIYSPSQGLPISRKPCGHSMISFLGGLDRAGFHCLFRERIPAENLAQMILLSLG